MKFTIINFYPIVKSCPLSYFLCLFKYFVYIIDNYTTMIYLLCDPCINNVASPCGWIML